MPVYEAVTEAGRRRLRPILMTTLTTILALLPLVRVVIGGLTVSTLITLVLIPVIYTFFHATRIASK